MPPQLRSILKTLAAHERPIHHSPKGEILTARFIRFVFFTFQPTELFFHQAKTFSELGKNKIINTQFNVSLGKVF